MRPPLPPPVTCMFPMEDNDGGDGAVYDHSDGSKPVSVAAKLARQLSLSKRQGSTRYPCKHLSVLCTCVRGQVLIDS